jgi:hypothetical protein
VLYTADGAARVEAFEQPRLGEKHQFRIIVSPEDATSPTGPPSSARWRRAVGGGKWPTGPASRFSPRPPTPSGGACGPSRRARRTSRGGTPLCRRLAEGILAGDDEVAQASDANSPQRGRVSAAEARQARRASRSVWTRTLRDWRGGSPSSLVGAAPRFRLEARDARIVLGSSSDRFRRSSQTPSIPRSPAFRRALRRRRGLRLPCLNTVRPARGVQCICRGRRSSMPDAVAPHAPQRPAARQQLAPGPPYAAPGDVQPRSGAPLAGGRRVRGRRRRGAP